MMRFFPNLSCGDWHNFLWCFFPRCGLSIWRRRIWPIKTELAYENDTQCLYVYCATDINAPSCSPLNAANRKGGYCCYLIINVISSHTNLPLFNILCVIDGFHQLFWACRVCILSFVIELVQIINSNTWKKKKKWETFWNRHNLICLDLRGSRSSKLGNPW